MNSSNLHIFVEFLFKHKQIRLKLGLLKNAYNLVKESLNTTKNTLTDRRLKSGSSGVSGSLSLYTSIEQRDATARLAEDKF